MGLLTMFEKTTCSLIGHMWSEWMDSCGGMCKWYRVCERCGEMDFKTDREMGRLK